MPVEELEEPPERHAQIIGGRAIPDLARVPAPKRAVCHAPVTASIVATSVWSQGESMNTSTIRACFRAVFGVYLVATCRSKSAF